MDDGLVERLAALCHSQWAGWMRYLFSKAVLQDGSAVIPQEFVERWVRQMNTPYGRLSESEKESDRTEAKKFIDSLAEYLRYGKQVL